MKKKMFAVTILIIVAILIIDANIKNTDYGNPDEYLKDIESTWGIDLKRAEKIIYYNNDQSGWHGDGYIYTVIKYNEVKPEGLFKWRKMDEKTVKEINACLDHLDVEKEERPRYKQCLYYSKEKEQDELYILREKNDQKKLYVLELLI